MSSRLRARQVLDGWWGRLCRDRPCYDTRAAAHEAAARVSAAGRNVSAYRCLACALRGRAGWHTTSPSARTPPEGGRTWRPML